MHRRERAPDHVPSGLRLGRHREEHIRVHAGASAAVIVSSRGLLLL